MTLKTTCGSLQTANTTTNTCACTWTILLSTSSSSSSSSVWLRIPLFCCVEMEKWKKKSTKQLQRYRLLRPKRGPTRWQTVGVPLLPCGDDRFQVYIHTEKPRLHHLFADGKLSTLVEPQVKRIDASSRFFPLPEDPRVCYSCQWSRPCLTPRALVVCT